MRIVPVVMALGACGPAHLGGQIDGEPVGGARDAFFDTLSVNLGPLGDYEATVVVVTDFPTACDVYDDLASTFELSCDALCDEYLDLAETYHLRQETYWSTIFTVNTSDEEVGTFDYDPAVGEGEFSTAFYRYDGTDLFDADACEDACEDGELLQAEDEQGEDGELEIDRADSELIHGRFDVDFGGDDRLSGGFSARPCDTSDWL
ncbi:MAG: hypothetical protein ABMB14_25745 [Myxococcota bacterium]